MTIGLSPNRRDGSKAVWTVLLTIESPISWSILVFGIAILGLVMAPDV